MFLRSLLIVVVALATLTSCANLGQELDPPKVTLESFDSVPGSEGAPRFKIVLRIMNPNTTELDIAGISYSIEFIGRELIAGVTNDVPVIAGYSEETVTLQASLQLFELLRLFAALGTSADQPLEYRFKAKIDFNGLVPTQRVEEKGEITLK